MVIARRNLLGLLFVLMSRDAVAQRVAGTVRDSATNSVVAGAVVSVLDSANNTLSRGLTDGSGRYSLELNVAARQLKVVRIGFRPRTAPMQGLGTRSPLDVNMQRIAALLTAVAVNDERVCSTDQRRLAALNLWEQARAGLLAAIVAREANPAQAVILTYTRQVDADRERVISQTAKKISGQTSRPFVAAAPPGTFAVRGYSEKVGATTMFYAPDADVLLDESFARTHCFTIANADAKHPDAIGLAFEPARRRDELVDVRGVLWMDTGTPALRSIEYRYVGSDSALTHREAFGIIHFRAMQNGVVFIDDWMSHLPVLEERPGSVRAYPQRGRSSLGSTFHVDQFSETGGMVTSARWPDGQVWKTPLEPLSGIVAEEKTGKPMTGVVIAIPASGDTVLTDSLGQFAVFPLFPGKYLLTIADTMMGAFVSPRDQEREVTIRAAGENVVMAELPSRIAAIRKLCDVQEIDERHGILLARLDNTDERGRLPSGLSVGATWYDGRNFLMTKDVFVAPLETGGFAVDDKGRFSACNVPRERTLRLVLRRDGRVVADTAVTLARDTDIERFLWPVSAQALVPRASVAGATFSGHVTLASGGPLAGADVWLPMTDRHATTDAEGRFSFADLAPTFTVLQVRKVGFAAQRDTITFTAGAVLTRSYSLIAQKAILDTVRTTALANAISPALRGFEERRTRKESGYFVPDSTLRAHEGKSLSSILTQHVSGVTMIPGRMGTLYMVSTRKQCKGSSMSCMVPDCFVTTYLDGILIYSAVFPAPPPDANQIKVNELAAIEFYPSPGTAPVQYNATGSGCGVLLLWTRER